MKLYFETQAQLALFLLNCAMGFALGLLPEALYLMLGRRLRAVCDVLGFLVLFLMLSGYLLFFAQASVRLYNLFGLVVGLILYALGVRRAAAALSRRVSAARARKSVHSLDSKEESEASHRNT